MKFNVLLYLEVEADNADEANALASEVVTVIDGMPECNTPLGTKGIVSVSVDDAEVAEV